MDPHRSHASKPAAYLGRAIAVWFNRNNDPEDIDVLHQRQRSVKWRVEPDGMTVLTLRLPPLLAGMLIVVLTSIVMRSEPTRTVGEEPRSPTVRLRRSSTDR